jgi:cell division septum initiation protein DivIVA
LSIRLRTKKLLKAGLIGAAIMLVIAGIIFAIWFNLTQKEQEALKAQYDSKIQEYEDWALANKKGYSIKEDIKAGTQITEDMVQEVVVPKRAASKDILANMTLIERGIYAKVDMKANSVLTEATVYKDEMLEKDEREAEYSFIVLPSKLKKDGFIDVRIQFPNGDDYILLSKKSVKDLNTSTVWMNLNEGELLMMSSAIVDAYLEEAKIYAVEYVDGYVQPESDVTYPVKSNIMELINESPNIVNVAELNLEKQNRARLEASLQSMDKTEKTQMRQQEEAERQAVQNEQAKQQEAQATQTATQADAFDQTEGSETGE